MKTPRRTLYGLAAGICLVSATAGVSSAMSLTPQIVFEFSTGTLWGAIVKLNLWSKVALCVLPFVGLFAMWSESRAWFYALCGNYAGAAAIYEERLRRDGTHMRSYLRLAGLYLLQGRNDARAMLAYRTVLQINFAMRAHRGLPEDTEFELVS